MQPIPWSNFFSRFIWKQDEHIAIIGPTGQGKTTLALALMERRKYPIVLACKPKDEVLDDVKSYGYETVREWPPSRNYRPTKEPKICLWPKAEKLRSGKVVQQREFMAFLEDAFESGGYSIFADEVRYLTHDLKMKDEIVRILLQGRSNKISFVSSTQRPRHVPLEIYNQSTHLFLFRESDRANLQRLSEIGGVNTEHVKKLVEKLPQFHFLYVNTRNGGLAISKYQLGS